MKKYLIYIAVLAIASIGITILNPALGLIGTILALAGGLGSGLYLIRSKNNLDIDFEELVEKYHDLQDRMSYKLDMVKTLSNTCQEQKSLIDKLDIKISELEKELELKSKPTVKKTTTRKTAVKKTK